jgi:hypothetical protein
MAGLSSPSPYQLLAQQLSSAAASPLSTCQKAFQEALDKARVQAKKGKNASKVLRRLQDLNDDQKLLADIKQDLENSPNHGPDAARQLDKRFAALSSRFPYIKKLAEAAAEFGRFLHRRTTVIADLTDPVARPIWGCVAFITLVSVELPAASEPATYN